MSVELLFCIGSEFARVASKVVIILMETRPFVGWFQCMTSDASQLPSSSKALARDVSMLPSSCSKTLRLAGRTMGSNPVKSTTRVRRGPVDGPSTSSDARLMESRNTVSTLSTSAKLMAVVEVELRAMMSLQ